MNVSDLWNIIILIHLLFNSKEYKNRQVRILLRKYEHVYVCVVHYKPPSTALCIPYIQESKSPPALVLYICYSSIIARKKLSLEELKYIQRRESICRIKSEWGNVILGFPIQLNFHNFQCKGIQGTYYMPKFIHMRINYY